MPGGRLFRSRRDSFLLGVCGGLGKYFSVDSNAVRLAFILLAAWNGLGVLLYLATVLIVPEEPVSDPAPPSPSPAPREEETRRMRMLGWLLVLAGGYLLLRTHPLFRPILQDPVFPVVLILGGLVLLFQRGGFRQR
ncbi:MAG TPA: PspC domain-containing protein [bacterium]|nr:PspC domain-containing protein [bacterium]